MIRLQEISAIFISQNRLVEGKDYVRAEWLKVDFTPSVQERVNVINLPIQSDTFDFQIKYQGDGSCVILYTGECSYYFDNNKTRLDLWKNNTVYKSITVPNVNVKRFTSNSEAFYVDGIQIPKYGFPVRYASVNAYQSRVVISYSTIEVDGVTRYVPCQLLRSIPSTLDANGIARQSGECGMVDTYSGLFYGNVASNGAFTVENLDESGTVEDTRLHQIYKNKLVEGEDYIIGEQLATTVVGASADGGGYIGAMLKLPDDYLQFSAEFNLKKVSSKLNLEMCVSFVAANKIGQGIARRYGNKHIMYLTTGPSVNILHDFGVIEGDMIIQVTQSEVIINGVSAARVASPNAPQCYIGTSNRALKYSNIIKVTQDDSRIFVPCRLLRSIPRNLDAQCKSRSAGECGMIDLVSGRFYGNVAESGAFSLAWDEWLKDCSIQLGQLPYSINTIPPHIEYHTRIKVSKLTAEYQDFGFCKLSLTKIAVGDNYPQEWDFSNWGTSEWATVVITYKDGTHATCYVNDVNVTGHQTTQIPPIYQNVHIMLGETMQLSKIIYQYTIDTSDILGEQIIFTRYVDETTGQQGLISDQDGTIIYAD